ncbi:hypothetical protein PILCRDRAFT_7710 [Piloderma croceum F 1598]|uniref:Uncharacterized protein n=1 Tax=Piloderma croceum (strain F 1598) TaxID=765440 RepID=A0A0C3BZM0_PILCF|nr:hypothetical protein PILCRDRAFT_7710 [Piloderma croceum F 1598]
MDLSNTSLPYSTPIATETEYHVYTIDGLDTASMTTSYSDVFTIVFRFIAYLEQPAVESVVIRTRLRDISPRFPHSNDDDILEGIYDELVELSSSKIRGIALGIIVLQIRSMQTNQLLQALRRWNAREIRLFVSELMLSSFPKLVRSTNGPTEMHRMLCDLYFSDAHFDMNIVAFNAFIGELREFCSEGCPSDSVMRLTTSHSPISWTTR